jgi:hypothetical protein
MGFAIEEILWYKSNSEAKQMFEFQGNLHWYWRLAAAGRPRRLPPVL